MVKLFPKFERFNIQKDIRSHINVPSLTYHSNFDLFNVSKLYYQLTVPGECGHHGRCAVQHAVSEYTHGNSIKIYWFVFTGTVSGVDAFKTKQVFQLPLHLAVKITDYWLSLPDNVLPSNTYFIDPITFFRLRPSSCITNKPIINHWKLPRYHASHGFHFCNLETAFGHSRVPCRTIGKSTASYLHIGIMN